MVDIIKEEPNIFCVSEEKETLNKELKEALDGFNAVIDKFLSGMESVVADMEEYNKCIEERYH